MMPSCSSTVRLLFFTLLLLVTTTVSAKSHLRPTKKYLRCNVETFGCDAVGEDRVNVCHFDGHQFSTLCVQSRSSIVEHLHAQDYCGECVVSQRRAFKDTDELQAAVTRYLDDPTSHKELSANYGYPMGQWNVGKVQDFSHLFAKRVHFNEDLGLWNMSSATDLSFLFWHAHSFEGTGIGQWDVSNVTTMERTFFGAEQLTADISGWKTTSLTNLRGTFWRATSFNSALNTWDTSKVTTMSRCFSDATSFHRPLDHWNTEQVLDMSFMFWQATQFQQDITNWKVNAVMNFEGMFGKAPYFSKQKTSLLTAWNIHEGANVQHMFTAPRDVSLRSQQLQGLQVDVQAMMRATARRQNNATHVAVGDRPEGVGEGEALAEEILCHGGVCM